MAKGEQRPTREKKKPKKDKASKQPSAYASAYGNGSNRMPDNNPKK